MRLYRLASQIVAAILPSVKLNGKLKTVINTDLRRNGFDGNGHFGSTSKALATVFNVIEPYGYEIGEVVNSHSLLPDSGTIRVNFAKKNSEDPFSPSPVSNSVLHFSWHKRSEYNFEVIAYLS